MSNAATASAAIDPVAVLAALGVSASPAPVSIQPVRGGADAAIWRVDRGDERFALRVLRPSQEGQARVEAIAMRAASGGGLPVPDVVATSTWRDHPALLLSWRPGRPLAELLAAPAMNAAQARALGAAFGRAQGAIHGLPPPPDLRAHPVPWETWAGPDSMLEHVLARVPRRASALLHLDFHPLNVLVTNGEVTAVLDWANARLGDPRADLARTRSILDLAPLSGTHAALRRRAFAVGWQEGYRQETGRFGGLAPFCWWAGLVMERDLAPRLGRPDLPWLTPAYLARVRRWTAGWHPRASAETNRRVAPYPGWSRGS